MEQRIAGAGVRGLPGRRVEFTYSDYQAFLNSTFLNLAAGNTHDYFNERGLYVRNEPGDLMRVGGDNSLIEKSDPRGAELAAEATRLSRRAIDDLLEKGTTDLTVDRIWRLVPTSVYIAPLPSGTRFIAALSYGLEEWHDKVLHDLCIRKIFPDAVDSVSSNAVRALSPELSEDFSTPAPPVPSNIGDFVLPEEAAARTA